MLDVLSKVCWMMLGSIPVIIFQIIKWLINNHKLKKEFSRLKVEKIVDAIDYEKLADVVLKKLEEKDKCLKK